MDFIDMLNGIYGESDCSLIFIRSEGDGEVTQTFIYNYHKGETGEKNSFCDIQALRFFMPLRCLLPIKKKKKNETVKKNIFKVF